MIVHMSKDVGRRLYGSGGEMWKLGECSIAYSLVLCYSGHICSAN